MDVPYLVEGKNRFLPEQQQTLYGVGVGNWSRDGPSEFKSVNIFYACLVSYLANKISIEWDRGGGGLFKRTGGGGVEGNY